MSYIYFSYYVYISCFAFKDTFMSMLLKSSVILHIMVKM